MASTAGSSAAVSMNRCTLVANESYGWWTRMSPAAMAREDVGLLARLEVEARVGDRRPRAEAQRRQRHRSGERHQVLQGERRPRPRRPPAPPARARSHEQLEHPARHPRGRPPAARRWRSGARAAPPGSPRAGPRPSPRCAARRRCASPGRGSTRRTSMPGNSRSRLWAITSSSGTKRRRLRHLHPARQDVRRLDAGEARLPVAGRLAPATASDRLTFEMNGNGCAGSTASGVRIGKICPSNSSAQMAALARPELVPAQRSPGRAGAGRAAARR